VLHGLAKINPEDQPLTWIIPPPMTRQNLACIFHRAATLRVSAGIVSLALGSALFAISPCSLAQITQGNGSSQQENRTSPMGAASESSATAVHESQKPQTRDGASSKPRGKTAGQGHKSQGAGGFDNGLYGTGTGSNK
jgi:hypothetical protein